MKRHDVTVAHARWAQRHLRRGCSAVGLPNLSRYIRVAWLARFSRGDRDAIGIATVATHYTYVGRGKRKLRPARTTVAPRPFRIRLLRRWWLEETWKGRRQILMHELAHILCELSGTPCHTHGRGFDAMLKRLDSPRKRRYLRKGRTK